VEGWEFSFGLGTHSQHCHSDRNGQSFSALAKPNTVIPTGGGRRFFLSFAPAKESAAEVEESLFDLSRKPRTFLSSLI
jgi:hypothetical protein